MPLIKATNISTATVVITDPTQQVIFAWTLLPAQEDHRLIEEDLFQTLFPEFERFRILGRIIYDIDFFGPDFTSVFTGPPGPPGPPGPTGIVGSFSPTYIPFAANTNTLSDSGATWDALNARLNAPELLVKHDDNAGKISLLEVSNSLPNPYNDVGILLQSTQGGQTVEFAVNEGVFFDFTFPSSGGGTFTVWGASNFQNEIFAIQNNADPTLSAVSIVGILNVGGIQIATGPNPTTGQALIFDGFKFAPAVPSVTQTLQIAYNGGNNIAMSSFTPIDMFAADTSPVMALHDAGNNIRWLFHGNGLNEYFGTPVDGSSTFTSNAPLMTLNGYYWNGTFSTQTQAVLNYVVDDTTPTTHFSVAIDASEQFKIYRDGHTTTLGDALIGGTVILANQATASISNSTEAKIRYNDITKNLEASIDTGTYSTILTAIPTLQQIFDASGSPISTSLNAQWNFGLNGNDILFQGNQIGSDIKDDNGAPEVNWEVFDANFASYDNYITITGSGTVMVSNNLGSGAYGQINVNKGSLALFANNGGATTPQLLIDPLNGIDLQMNNLSKVRVNISGDIGFFGVNPVARPTVTGSKGGNAALSSLTSALASLGLIIDNTT